MHFRIHIGPHKTATTTIQWHLFECVDQLRDRGTWYPLDHYPNGAQHAVGWQIIGRSLTALGVTGDFPSWQDRMATWVADARDHSCDTLFLSSEVLSFLTDEQWEILLGGIKDIAGHDSTFEFLATYRDPSAAAQSWYSTFLMQGGSTDLEVAQPIVEKRFENFYLDFPKMVELTKQPTVTTLSYFDSQDAEPFVVRWFDEVFGVNTWVTFFGDREPRRENVSLTPDYREKLLAFNKTVSPHVRIGENGRIPEDVYEVIDRSMAAAAWYVAHLHELAETENELVVLRRRLRELRRRLRALESSRSYRLGRAFLWPAHFVREVIRKK